MRRRRKGGGGGDVIIVKISSLSLLPPARKETPRNGTDEKMKERTTGEK
jgi:hypothetical protein